MVKIRLDEGTHYDTDAAKILANSGLWDLETSKNIIDLLYKKVPKIDPATGEVVLGANGEPETEGPDIPAMAHADNAKWITKYLVGIAKMIVKAAGGNVRNAASFIEDSVSTLNSYFTWLRTEDEEGVTMRDKLGGSTFDRQFMDGNITYADVEKQVEENQELKDAESQNELANQEYGASNFELVPIDSFEQMHKLFGGKWTGDGTDTNGTYAGRGGSAWCHANDTSESSYRHYLNMAGKGSKYFVLAAKNFKDIPFNRETNYEMKGKDEYGNSLIALVVDRKGNLKYATLRCNHVWGKDGMGLPNPDNQYDKYSDLSAIANFNVQEKVKEIMGTSGNQIYIIEGGVCKGFFDEDDADSVEVIEIPEGVTTIGKQAFALCDNLTVVTFPKSLKVIESDAFFSCTSLEDIDSLHATQLTAIGAGAFCDCVMLSKVVLPNSIEVIKKKAFAKCARLSNFVIKGSSDPGTNVVIDSTAFLKTPVEDQVEEEFGTESGV